VTAKAAAPSDQPGELPGLQIPTVPKGLTSEQRQVASALVAAHAGNLPWLAAAIESAGYRRADAPTSVVTMQQFSELCGLTKPTIWNWVTHGLPRSTTSSGVATVDLRRAVPWLVRYYQDAVKTARKDAAAISGEARERSAEAKAALLEIELAEKKATMVRTEDHWRCFFAWMEAYVGAFRTKPAAWAQACAGEPAVRIRQLIERDLDQIFMSLQATPIPENIPPAAEEHFRAGVRALTTTAVPPEQPPKPQHKPEAQHGNPDASPIPAKPD
jgi:hypothetical protein